MKNENGITLMILVITIIIILIIASVSINALVGDNSKSLIGQANSSVESYKISEICSTLQSEIAALQYDEARNNGSALTKNSIKNIIKNYSDEEGLTLSFDGNNTITIKKEDKSLYQFSLQNDVLTAIGITYDNLPE